MARGGQSAGTCRTIPFVGWTCSTRTQLHVNYRIHQLHEKFMAAAFVCIYEQDRIRVMLFWRCSRAGVRESSVPLAYPNIGRLLVLYIPAVADSSIHAISLLVKGPTPMDRFWIYSKKMPCETRQPLCYRQNDKLLMRRSESTSLSSNIAASCSFPEHPASAVR